MKTSKSVIIRIVVIRNIVSVNLDHFCCFDYRLGLDNEWWKRIGTLLHGNRFTRPSNWLHWWPLPPLGLSRLRVENFNWAELLLSKIQASEMIILYHNEISDFCCRALTDWFKQKILSQLLYYTGVLKQWIASYWSKKWRLTHWYISASQKRNSKFLKYVSNVRYKRVPKKEFKIFKVWKILMPLPATPLIPRYSNIHNISEFNTVIFAANKIFCLERGKKAMPNLIIGSV